MQNGESNIQAKEAEAPPGLRYQKYISVHNSFTLAPIDLVMVSKESSAFQWYAFYLS